MKTFGGEAMLRLLALTLTLVVARPSAAADSTEQAVCAPACSAGQVCMRSQTEKPPLCVPVPAHAPLTNLRLPFEKTVSATCTHSAGSGSHSWGNAYYALDLASPYAAGPATIVASDDGKAFVFQSDDGATCVQPSGSASRASTDSCGKSWGNRIKILHRDGYYTFYVHLARALVKNGELVKKGQPIGVEGWTGAAGHRHLHWSVQKLPGTTPLQWEERISWDGESVPFRFTAVINGKAQQIDTAKLHCAHANIGAAPPAEQPVLRAGP